jgi:ketosteroid isomerase-like protein
MKPEELIERTRAFYQTALTDLEKALELYVATERFVWENPLPSHVPFGGTYEGHDGLRRYLALVNDTIEINQFEFGEVVAQGDTVMAAGHEASRVRATGRSYEMDFVHLVKFTPDGKLLSVREYNDTASIGEAFRLT